MWDGRPAGKAAAAAATAAAGVRAWPLAPCIRVGDAAGRLVQHHIVVVTRAARHAHKLQQAVERNRQPRDVRRKRRRPRRRAHRRGRCRGAREQRVRGDHAQHQRRGGGRWRKRQRRQVRQRRLQQLLGSCLERGRGRPAACARRRGSHAGLVAAAAVVRLRR
eukprot:360892-Chlamydomonas_euryale.AAC.3